MEEALIHEERANRRHRLLCIMALFRRISSGMGDGKRTAGRSLLEGVI